MARRNVPDSIILYIAPILVLIPALFGGQGIGPWNQIANFLPWSKGEPVAIPFDILQMDGVLQFYGWRLLVLDSWAHFQIPAWNPYVLGGAPLLANSQSGGLYPFHVILGILQVPVQLAMALLALIHLIIAGAGVRAVGKHFGGDDLIATLAGTSFALSAFMLSWTALPSVISTVCWIPWILLAIAKSMEDDRRRPILSGLLGCFPVSMMLLAGHLQFAAYGLIGAGVFWIAQMISRRKVTGLVMFVTLLIGAGLALPQLGPVMEYSKESHRRGAPTEAGYAAYSASALQPFELGSIGAADLLGTSNQFGPAPYQLLTKFWPSVIKRGSNYAESAIGVGAFVLAFAGISLFRRNSGSGAMIAVGLVGLLLATASPLCRALYFGVPGWSATGSPGRAGVLIVLSLCILAASAKVVPLRSKLPPAKNPQLLGMIFAFVFLIFALAVRLLAPTLPTFISAEGLGAYVQNSVMPFQGLSIGVISLLIIAYALQKDSSRQRWMLMVGALIAWLPTYLASPLTFGAIPAQAKLEDGEIKRVVIVVPDWQMVQISPESGPPPNLNLLLGTRQLGGYDSLISRSTVDMLKDTFGKDPAPPANGNMMLTPSGVDPTKLSGTGVSEVWSAVRGESSSALDKQVFGSNTYATLNGNPVVARSKGANSVVVSAGPGNLIVHERAISGWTATLNGRPIELNSGVWLEADLAESGEVVFTYAPTGGIALTPILGVLLSLVIVGGFAAFIFTSRSSTSNSELD